MTFVRLEERSDDGTTLDTLSGELSDLDWKLLIKYLFHLERALECRLINRGIPGITGMKWEKGGVVINAESYSNSELHELLYVLRPLILHNESASFGVVRSILGRCFKSKRFSAYLKELQHLFDHGQLAEYMQIFVGEQRLFDSSLLRTWLNGTQYHTEEEKAAAWQEIETYLNSENARAIVINQLKDRVSALILLGQVVRAITNKST